MDNKLTLMIKKCLLELLKNDEDVRRALNESKTFMAREPLVNKIVPHIDHSDPKDAELWDKLVLVAEGKLEKVEFNKKKIASPNHGIGFKSAKTIKEWSSKAYTKLGGKWLEKGAPVPVKKSIAEGVRSEISEAISVFGDEMSDIFKDTLNTVLEQDKHGHALKNNMNNLLEVATGYTSNEMPVSSPASEPDRSKPVAPVELKKEFGDDLFSGAKNWGALAFFDEKN